MPFDYDSHNVLAFIPVYNEVGKIGKVISKFSKRFADEICLIVDSPSTTIRNEIENSARMIDVPLHIIENQQRRGVGFAIRLGIQYAIENQFDIIVALAGNNKDDPREIPKFLDSIIYDNYDYIQGSRFLVGGLQKNTPVFRIFIIKIYSLLWSILTKSFHTDVTNGFRAYKTDIFKDKNINIFQNWLDGYELEFYIHYKVHKLGFKTRELPVSKIYPNNKNESYTKIHPINNFWNIVRPLIYLILGIRK